MYHNSASESLNFIKAQVKSQNIYKNSNKFTFEKNYINIDGMSEETVKILFGNIKKFGFCYEIGSIEMYKYCTNVQENICIDTRVVYKNNIIINKLTIFFWK